jgi:hypothetical protein
VDALGNRVPTFTRLPIFRRPIRHSQNWLVKAPVVTWAPSTCWDELWSCDMWSHTCGTSKPASLLGEVWSYRMDLPPFQGELRAHMLPVLTVWIIVSLHNTLRRRDRHAELTPVVGGCQSAITGTCYSLLPLRFNLNTFPKTSNVTVAMLLHTESWQDRHTCNTMTRRMKDELTLDGTGC